MKVAKERGGKLADVLEVQVELLIKDLRDLTPKDTGAAAGTKDGARRPMYQSHPAALRGLTIGNFEGASGWQPYEKTNGRHWAVVNPMWDIYLGARNYMGGVGSHFVEEAVRRFRERLKNLRTQ
jgi:hypothetical protein